MPRGKVENLIPVHTEEEARELGRKGGIASGEARRKRRDERIRINQIAEMLVEKKNYLNRYSGLAWPIMKQLSRLNWLISQKKATSGRLNIFLSYVGLILTQYSKSARSWFEKKNWTLPMPAVKPTLRNCSRF